MLVVPLFAVLLQLPTVEEDNLIRESGYYFYLFRYLDSVN